MPDNIGKLCAESPDFRSKFEQAELRPYSGEEAAQIDRSVEQIKEAIRERNLLRDSRQSIEAIDRVNVLIDSLFVRLADVSSRPLNEDILEEVKRLRAQDPTRTIVIGVYGPSTAGKSTLTKFILENISRFLGDVGNEGRIQGTKSVTAYTI